MSGENKEEVVSCSEQIYRKFIDHATDTLVNLPASISNALRTCVITEQELVQISIIDYLV